MLRRHAIRMSLARKISILFGAAVLLTICATLAFPWLQMGALHEEAMLMQANWVATAACQAVDLREPDWTLLQSRLDHRWPALAERLGLPAPQPKLIALGTQTAGGFREEAMLRLTDNPRRRYYWKLQDDGRLFRFALAIRGSDTDPHPHALRGIVDVRMPMPQATGVWNSVVTVLAGASGALLAILVFYMVTQRLVLSPVTILRHAAEQVTSGDIDVRSSIRSGDEFEQLSDAFNDMLVHLKRAQDELQTTNRSLDIRLGDLSETNVALYESNRVKGEFLTNVTHELRTPLVSIIGFAELLRDAWDNPDTDRKRLARYSQNILTSGRSLLEIINDLLDLAKIEAGKMEIHANEFDMTQLCRDLIDFVRPLADKKNQQLDLGLAESLPPFHSDSGKIKQILYNLLSNAIKFTPPGGSVSLTVHPHGDQSVRLIVADTGPGIPADKRDAIFDKFHQLDPSKTREHEGTGLGLAITRDLVRVLRGRIHLTSRLDEGTTFVVELPVNMTQRKAKPGIPIA